MRRREAEDCPGQHLLEPRILDSKAKCPTPVKPRSDDAFQLVLKNFSTNDLPIAATESRCIAVREAVEKHLSDTQQFNAQILLNAPFPIMVITSDHAIQYVNPAFVRLTGFTEEEVLGIKPPFPYWPQDKTEEYKNDYSDRKLTSLERQFCKKNGELFWVKLNSRPVEENGEVKYRLVNWADITQLKQINHFLVESENKFKILAEQSTNMIFINKAGRIVYANKQCEDVTGYSKADFYSHDFNFLSLIEPSYRDSVSRDFKDHSAGSEVEPFEYELVTRSGKRVPVLYSSKLINYENGDAILGTIVDISERKVAEEELRRREQMYRSLFENMLNGFAYCQMIYQNGQPWDFIYVAVNKAFVLQTGLAGVVGKKVSEVIPGIQESNPEVFQIYGRVASTGTAERFESFIPELDMWFEISVYSPEKGYFVAVFDVITERKRAEQALAEREQKYKDLAESITDVFVALDKDLHYIYWNKAAEKLTGLSPAEALGKGFFDIYPNNERTRIIRDSFLESMITGKPQHCVAQYPGGGNLIHEISIYPSSAGVSVFIKDVTASKKAEDALQFSDAAFKSIHEAVFALDSQSLVTHWNHVCEELFGIDAADAIGKYIGDLISILEDYPGQNKKRIGLLKEKGFNREEQVYRTPRGDIWLDVRSHEIESGGQRTGWVILGLDISERKKAEEERRLLEEKAQISGRLASVGEMAAGVAHEINNPLTGVLGFSRLLLEKKDVPQEIRDDLEIIADGSQRVSEIVKRLLTFARQTKPMRTSVSLNEILDNTLRLRDYVLKTSNIEVSTHFDPDLPRIVVDPGQLQQVFLNLIVNAEQAMKTAHGKGTLVVATEKRENGIRITFQDDGPGIKEEDKKRLFNPFFTTKGPGEGTGLGLSLSRSIVVEHGGEIRVESEEGKGAVFRIDLPISENHQSPDAALKVPPPKAASPGKKGLMLVVDDEPAVRRIVERVLTSGGHAVDTTENPAEALLKVKNSRYDLLFIDVRMPGISGIELYHSILKESPEMAKKIIFMTGDIMGPDVRAFLAENNLPYLAKPFDIDVLKDKVFTMLNTGQS